MLLYVWQAEQQAGKAGRTLAGQPMLQFVHLESPQRQTMLLKAGEWVDISHEADKGCQEVPESGVTSIVGRFGSV